MMLGLKLAKHGESHLGIGLRLWLANRSEWKLDYISLTERINNGIGRDKFLDSVRIASGKQGVELIKDITSSVTDITYPHESNRNIVESEQIKQCQRCSQIGYHSHYFNHPWLRKCPVHNKTLTTHCSSCGEPWSTLSKIQTRQCRDCGIRLSARELSERNAYDCVPYENAFKPFDDLFSAVPNVLYCERVHESYLRDARSDEGCRKLAYASAVADINNRSELERKHLCDAGVSLHDCLKFKFNLVSTENHSSVHQALSRSEKRMMVQTRLSVLKKAYKLLASECMKHNNHRLESCQHAFRFDSSPCEYCATWYALKYSRLAVSHASPMNPLFRFNIPFSYPVETRDPGFAKLLIEPETYGRYEVPLWISQIIYHMDLWSYVLQIHTLTKHYLEVDETQSLVSKSYMQGKHSIFSPDTKYLSHCYFFKEEELGYLILQAEFLRKELPVRRNFLTLTECC